MKRLTCYACERPVTPSSGIVVENLSDGEQLVMHRPCILKIADGLLDATELHHQMNVQAIFRDGNRALQERKDEDTARASRQAAVAE